ncbi:MAG: hypothetical protein ACT4NL_02615, partial [Pseudomarimonas sp.]
MTQLLAGLALLGSAFAVNAQSINFTAPGTVINVFVGDPISAEVRTLNASGVPTGGGLLNFSLQTCSAVQFSTTPPSTADGSGFTTAQFTAQSPGTCFVDATWDPDFTGPQPFVATSQSLQINVSAIQGNPAALEFTAPKNVEFVEVGQTVGAEVESRVMSVLTGGGALTFEIEPSCPHATLVPPVPTTALSSGLTSATVMGVSTGSCEVLARWDHDNNIMTPDAVDSLTLFVLAGEPIITSTEGPANIISTLEDPTFAVNVIRDGQPFVANLQWIVDDGSGKPFFFGGPCNGSFATDVNGNGRFVFSEQTLSTQVGDYQVTAQAFDPQNCRTNSADVSAPNGLPPPQVVYTFGVEPIELVFDAPPNEAPRNQPVTFNLLLRTTPSGIPVAGIPIDWNFTGTATPAAFGVTPNTNASGQTSFVFTPTSLGFRSVNIENYSAGVSNSRSLGVFDLALSLEQAPPALTFTDEIGANIIVLATKSFGAPQRGSFFPVGDVPVTFTITSGNGLFTENNSTTFVATTGSTDVAPGTSGPIAGPGEAIGSPVRIGRTASPVQLTISSPGFPSLNASYQVTPSTYVLQAVSSPNVNIKVGQNTQLVAQVQRGSSGQPTPIGAGETVTFNITPPANGATIDGLVLTDGSSNATSTFTPQVAGIYQVAAQFDPGIAGVSPSVVNYAIDVAGPAIVKSLVPFDGDMTRGGAGFSFPISVRYQENGVAAVPASPETVLWSVTSGDADVSPASSPVGSVTALANATVTFGSNPGPVIVSAQLQSSPNATTFFYLEFEENIVLTVVEPASRQFDLSAGDPFEIVLSLADSLAEPLSDQTILISGDLNTLPSSLVTDSDGLVTIGGSAPSSPGRYVVEFLYEGSPPPLGKASGVPPLSEFVVINVIAEPVGSARLVQSEGDGQRGLIGRPAIPLKVLYTLNDVPAAGVSVQWVVNGGGSPPTANTITDAAGFASFAYTFASTPGPVTIDASVGEVSARFTVTAELARFTAISGNAQSGAVQTTADQPLVVELKDPAGVALANQAITWTIASGSAALVGGSTGGATT